MDLLQPGMELLTNSDLTEVTVEGDNRTNLEMLVRKVGYANTREFPTPGRRNLKLTTTVTCDTGKIVNVTLHRNWKIVLCFIRLLITGTGCANVCNGSEASNSQYTLEWYRQYGQKVRGL